MTDTYNIIKEQNLLEEVRLRLFNSVKRGGFGIISSELNCDVAYIGSLALCANNIIQLCPALINTDICRQI